MGFQALAIQMGVSWGLGMLNRAMAGRRPRPPKPRPDDGEFPLVKVGTPVPLVYGTVYIDTPLLIWAGLFSSHLQPASGVYMYRANALFAVGVPPQQVLSGAPGDFFSNAVLMRVRIAGRAISLGSFGGGVTHGNSIAFNLDLGGEGNGGRVQGYLEFFDGRADQVITSYPAAAVKRIDKAFEHASSSVDRSLVPGYRNQILLAILTDRDTVGSDATFGESADFPAIAVEVRATDGTIGTGVDANPAWVIYDLITARVYKLGYDATLVDLASFEACAATLITEGHGCSVKLDAEEDIEHVINALLAQVDGVIDEDPSTGLLSMRLIRADYVLGDLREMNVDNTIGRPRVTQTGWLENANHIDVEFTNRAKQYKTDSIPARRLSNAISQGYRHRPRTVQYPYCMNATLAGKLAARDAALLCRPLMTCSAVLSREFYDLRRGQALKANWPQISVTDKVFRVLDIDRGQLADDKIRVTLIEDVFDNAAGAFAPDDPVVAVADELPILHRLFDEAPLWLTKQAFAAGSISDSSTPRVLASGRLEPEQSQAVAYAAQTKLTSEPDASYASDLAAQSFPTTAKVATAYSYRLEPYDTTTGLVIEDVTGELAETLAAATSFPVSSGANLVRINGEMMAYESVTDLGAGRYRLNNVWRGLHDTTADDHEVGDIVYWLDSSSVGARAWASTQEVDVQSIPVLGGPGLDHATDTLVISGDGLEISVVASRTQRPLRGADFRANALERVVGDLGLPSVALGHKRITDYDGGLDVEWRQRNSSPLTVVRGDDAGSYPVPAFSSWSIRGRKVGEDDQSIKTAVLAATSATSILLGKIGHGEIDLLLRTLNSVFGSSWQDARIRVTAHRARNLLDNGGAERAATTSWTTTDGTTTAMTGATSLEQRAGASWFRVTGAAS